MTGTLYVIGVGPGDPELLTLKAARILRSVPCICVPKGREEGSSLALSIVNEALDLSGKEILEAHFPMKKTKEKDPALDSKWDETAGALLEKLDSGIDMAFITIGDPTIYSTFFYLYDRLLGIRPELNIEIIPGVSSINASAARAKLSLGLADEKIAILPATYANDIGAVFQQFDTVVLMKVHKVFDNILELLKSLRLAGNAVYISRAGMDDEMVCRDLREVSPEDLNYFSIVVVKK